MLTVRFLKASLGALAVAMPLVLVGVVGVSPAQADVVPTPISVLPSEIVSGVGSSQVGYASAARMAQVYKFLTSPATVAALKDQAAGTATEAETAEISAAAESQAVPLALGGLTKVAGGVGVAYTGYKIGTSMGAPIAGKITTSIWGVDANDLVCGAASNGGVGQKMLSFFAGQDCSKFGAADGFTPNQDASATATLAPLCGSAGDCLTYLGAGDNTWTSSGGQTLHDASLCFTMSGPSNAGGVGDPVVAYTATLSDGRDFSRVNGSGVTSVSNLGYNPGTTPPCGSATAGIKEVLRASDPTDPDFQSVLSTLKVQCMFIYDGSGTQTCADPTADKPTAGNADPERTVSCDITASDGSTYTQNSAQFQESDVDWSKMIPACPTLDAGLLPTSTKLTLHTVGGSDQTLWSHDLSSDQTSDLDKYKECLTTVCQLILSKGSVSCFDSTTLCTDWYTDPTKSDDYTCTYDGQTVDLSECNVYEPTWTADAQRTGQIYADPVTAKPAPPTPDTKETAAVSPGTDSTVQNAPAAKGADCFPGGWAAFNPLEWVEKPVQCVFTWAFIPSATSLATAQTQVASDVQNSSIGTLTSDAGQFSVIGIADGGCAGIPFQFDMYSLHVDAHLLAACPGDPLAAVAATTHTILTAVIVSAGVLASLRYIAMIFGGAGLGGIQTEFRMSDKRAEDQGIVPPRWGRGGFL